MHDPPTDRGKVVVGGQIGESLVDKKWSKNIAIDALFVLRAKPICKKNAS